MSTTKIKLAATQLSPAWFNLTETITKTIAAIAEAAAAGANLIAFPECWIPGYPGFCWVYGFGEQRHFVKRLHENALSLDSAEFRQLQAAAKQHNIHVMLGFVKRSTSGGTLYMSQALLDNHGQVVLHRQKLKPTSMERTIFGDGMRESIKNVVSTQLGRIGALQCWEHLQPLLRQSTMMQGEQLHVAAWPTMADEIVPWSFGRRASALASQYYAMETGTFVICSTQCHTTITTDVYDLPEGVEGRSFKPPPGSGFAAIYAPDGKQLTDAVPSDWEGILYAEVDLSECVLAKSVTDPVGHYLRDDILRFEVGRMEEEEGGGRGEKAKL